MKNIGVFIIHPGVAITRLNRFLPFFSVVYDMAVAPFVKSVSQVCMVPKKIILPAGSEKHQLFKTMHFFVLVLY